MTDQLTDYPYAGEDDKYVYYLIVDGLGISHYLRRPKGVHPSTGSSPETGARRC